MDEWTTPRRISARAVGALKWYLLGIAILNLLLGLGLFWLCQAMAYAYALVYGSRPKEFASLTSWVLRIHWWPYFLAGLAAVLATCAFRGRFQMHTFLHIALLMLALDGLILFITLVAFVLPFISTP